MMTLQAEEKESYLRNLEQSLRALSSRTSGDATLDKAAYSAMSPSILRLATAIHWLRFLDNEKNYHNNNGIYTELHLGDNGFPDIRDFRQLLSDQQFGDSHLGAVPEIADMLNSYKAALFQQSLSREEEDKLLESTREAYRKRKFYTGLKEIDLPKLTSCSENMVIKQLAFEPEANSLFPSSGNMERYNIIFTALDKINNIWHVCSLELDDERTTSRGFLGRQEVTDQVYMDGTEPHISGDLVSVLDTNFNQGAYQLMWILDRTAGIYPRKASSLIVGGFYAPQIPDQSETLKGIFAQHPDSFVLLARRDYIESKGQQIVGSMVRGIYGKEDLRHDEFMIIPTELKQSQESLVEMARMRPDAHIYEV